MMKIQKCAASDFVLAYSEYVVACSRDDDDSREPVEGPSLTQQELAMYTRMSRGNGSLFSNRLGYEMLTRMLGWWATAPANLRTAAKAFLAEEAKLCVVRLTPDGDAMPATAA